MQFAPLYPIIYQILKPIFPSCLWSGSSNSRTIALNFDDGLHPQYTPQLLQVLDKYNVLANFFWLGICVNRYPNIAQEVVKKGHWIGLHGYDHRNFPLLNSSTLKSSLVQTQTAIAQVCELKPKAVRDVRPPNGLFTPKTLKLLQEWNYRPVLWSVVPEDWEKPGIKVVVERVLKQVQNGSLIVLHDGYYGGEDVAEITNQLLPLLLHQGYKFVSIEELWKQ